MVFETGSVIVTGANSEEKLKKKKKKAAKALKALSFDVKFKNFRVTNIVGKVNLGKPIFLERILETDPTNSQFEPEIFPALIYTL